MSNMNSGYCGYAMSNRAVQAYSNGEKPLSKWTKVAMIERIEEWLNKDSDNRLNCTMSLLKKTRVGILKNLLLSYSSWHHTSSFINKTDFYEFDYEKLAKLTDEDIRTIVNIEKEEKNIDEIPNIYQGDIYYIEWTGSRKYSKANSCSLKNVSIEEKGCFYIIRDDSGNQILKKKIGSNGTRVVNYKEEEEKEKAKIERERYVRIHSSKEALNFYDSLEEKTYSRSNHIYPEGRKPSCWDYENGLDNFFNIGEHRLYEDCMTGVLSLETWDGSEWISEYK